MTPDLLRNLAAFALQAALITTAAGLLLQVLRIASAGTRYACWRVVLAACLIMPMLLQRPATTNVSTAPRDGVMTQNVSVEDLADAPVIAEATSGREVPWTGIAAAVLLAGALLRTCWLLAGLVRLRVYRRRGTLVDDAEFAAIQETLGTRAILRSVTGLTQPATFGLRRPVVLLPHSLSDSPPAFRRAVVTHELFHVLRRDWFWVLTEEIVCSALWFHPAILWLTSRIQLAREELVDELTVLATGDRKAYIEALLTFADAGRERPAPAFARRRHLFTRIVRLSKEGVMSSPRIVVSAAVVIAAVLSTGWYASHAFPIVSAAAAAQTAAAPVDSVAASPGQNQSSGAPDRQEWDAHLRETQASLKVLSESTTALSAAQGPRSGGAPRPGPAPVAAPPAGTKPITPENPIPRRLSSVAAPYPSQLRGSGYRAVVNLQVTLDASGTISGVRQISVEVGGGDPADQGARRRAGEVFSNAAAEAVRQWRYQSPADPPIAFLVTARFDGESDAVATQSDGTGGRGGFVTMTATTGFLRNDVGEFERRLAAIRAEQSQAAAQFGEQDQRVLELKKQIQSMERELERSRELQKRAEAGALTATVFAPGTAQSNGPGVFQKSSLQSPSGATPVRVGGNIKPPQKTKHVDPIYPEIAKSAHVQGVVILETLIDEQGRVADARILRSIPLLDQAALDAVREWEFTPTLLNGVPVPIVMTVTVQFTLPPV
jgi:protein TonB